MTRADRRAAYGALAALAVLALVLGFNLLTATRRIVDAYDAYDGLELSLESFEYVSPNDPVMIRLRVGNPSKQALSLEALDLRLSAGVHTVGGASQRPELVLAPGESTVLEIEATINDPNYVSQQTPPIEWLLNGRIQVKLRYGEPTWVPFGTRYIT